MPAPAITRAERAVVVLAAAAALAILVAPLATPYWWDAGAVYAPGAKWLLDHGFNARPGVFPSDLSRGHTPLFFLLLASAFRLLGAGPLAGHLVAFGFAVAAVFFTYALGRQLFGRAAGALAAALLLATPLFLTMSSEALPEVALTALTAAAFHAFARGRMAWCALWGTLLVLVKETGVACPLAIAGSVAIVGLRSRACRTEGRRLLFALLPVVPLAVFFLVQRRAEGWFVLPDFAGLYRRPHSLPGQLTHVAVSIFVDDGRIVAVLGAGALGLWRWYARRPVAPSTAEAVGSPGPEGRGAVFLALGLHALMNLAFFAKMFFLERYVLPVHVGTVVVAAGVLAPAGALALARARAGAPGLGIAAIAIAIGLSRLRAGTDMASGETTFRYLRAVRAYKALYERLEAGGGDPVVLTDWPLTDALREPFLGWVSRPFRCLQVEQDAIDGPIDRVVAAHALGSYERLRREAEGRGFRRVERVGEGGTEIELWGP